MVENDIEPVDEIYQGLMERARRAELDESNSELTRANETCARLSAENAEHLGVAEHQHKHLQSLEDELLEQASATGELREQLEKSREELAKAHEAAEKLAIESLDRQRNADALTERLSAAEEALLQQTAHNEILQAELHESRSSLAARRP